MQVNPRKIAIASEVKDVFSANNLITVFHYNDLNAQEWKNIRLKFRENEMKTKIFPSKVASKVLSTTPYNKICSLFCGATAIVSEKVGEPSTLNTFLKHVKKEEKLVLLGGMVDKQLLSPVELQQFSKLCSIHAVRQETVAVLFQIQKNLKQALDTPSQKLSTLLEQIR